MSLFVDNLIFEDQNTNESEEQVDHEASNQIENDLLNLIDDEPEASQSFEKDDTNSLEKSNHLDESDEKMSNLSNSDIIEQELKKPVE